MSATRFWFKLYTVNPDASAKRTFEASCRDALVAAQSAITLTQFTGKDVVIRCDGIVIHRVDRSNNMLPAYMLADQFRTRFHAKSDARHLRRMAQISGGAK